MTADTVPQTKLLKSRIKVTRYFALLGVFMLLFCTPKLDFEDVTEWLGYACLIVAVLGRMFCTMYVGGRKNAELVATGPYSIVRNPLYVFSFIGVLGLGLVSGMLTFLFLIAGIFILYYPRVVAREEGFLEERFGDAYRQYKANVPAWIPNFKLWRSPETIETSPKFILITLRDAVWFLAAFPILEAIEYAHEMGWLPVLMQLY